MGYVNTGKERCKICRFTRYVGGVPLIGFPKDFSILSAFSVNGNSYGNLTETDFQQLANSEYIDRLADFKIYIQKAEGIASVDAITESGYEAYRTNTTSCPIGQ
jgi:hypothetical protein